MGCSCSSHGRKRHPEQQRLCHRRGAVSSHSHSRMMAALSPPHYQKRLRPELNPSNAFDTGGRKQRGELPPSRALLCAPDTGARLSKHPSRSDGAQCRVTRRPTTPLKSDRRVSRGSSARVPKKAAAAPRDQSGCHHNRARQFQQQPTPCTQYHEDGAITLGLSPNVMISKASPPLTSSRSSTITSSSAFMPELCLPLEFATIASRPLQNLPPTSPIMEAAFSFDGFAFAQCVVDDVRQEEPSPAMDALLAELRPMMNADTGDNAFPPAMRMPRTRSSLSSASPSLRIRRNSMVSFGGEIRLM